MSDSEKQEFKETYDKEKITVEYKDLKAETEHGEGNSNDAITYNTDERQWDISVNGDKIATQRNTTSGIKRELRNRYKDGQAKMKK